jgi:hypothetical protein
MGQKKDLKDYVKSFFLLESYKATYAGAIIHPHNTDFNAPLRFNNEMFNNGSDKSADESADDLTLPPSTRRPPGRPKKRRIRVRMEDEEEGRPVRLQRCGHCRAIGHSKRTCREVIG